MKFKKILLLSFIVTACKNSITKSHTTNLIGAKNTIVNRFENLYGYDSSYIISKTHKPYIVTGYFNSDNSLDTVIIVRNKKSGKDALLIKHSNKEEIFLIKRGNVLNSNFVDFNWVETFEKVERGTKIWNNVVNGEIVGEDQVAEKDKILLKTDAILLHVDEASGGGVLFYKNGNYHWIQQD